MLATDPSADYRAVAVALRVGSLLLAGGSSTDEVERSMRRVAMPVLGEIDPGRAVGAISRTTRRRRTRRGRGKP